MLSTEVNNIKGLIILTIMQKPNPIFVLLDIMCCFPLAEARNKRKTFSRTHLGVWVLVCRGYRSHGLSDGSLFLLPFAIA